MNEEISSCNKSDVVVTEERIEYEVNETKPIKELDSFLAWDWS